MSRIDKHKKKDKDWVKGKKQSNPWKRKEKRNAQEDRSNNTEKG